MTLSEFKLLTDENIDLSISEYLRSQGFDVFAVKRSELQGKADIDIHAFAMSQNRVILTHDTDFSEIVYKNKTAFIGLIYLQPGHIQPAFTIQTLAGVLSQNMEVQSPFIIVAENKGTTIKIRVRNNVDVT